MKHFTLSIATGKRQEPQNRLYQTQAGISTLEALKEAARWDHTAGTFTNNQRSNEHFMNADCIIMDCDNDQSDNPADWLTPEALAQRLPQVEFSVIFSRNHMRAKKEGKAPRPRWHVYFPLSEAVSKADDIRKLKEKLLVLVPEFDAGAKDAARFIYGVEQSEGEYHEGTICIDEFVITHGISIPETIPSHAHVQSEPTVNNAKSEASKQTAGIIPEGHRHDTLLKVAVKALLNHPEHKARELFEAACAQCVPPHDHDDISRIWRDAVEFTQKEKAKKEDDMFTRRDKFLEGKHYMFYGSVQGGCYYSYDEARGCWQLLPDATLQKRIAAFFNHTLKPKHVREISELIRLFVTVENRPVFNRKPLFLFSNGALELDRGIFRQPTPDDFLTWRVDYPYDPSASCPRYEAFLHEVSMNEQSRINLLDDMVSYVLYPDCRLERFFFLLGNGDNGKSVFLHTVKSLFENSNPHENEQSVTTIQPKDFKDPTRRIMLAHSLVNIAFDIDPNLRQCESDIKSIASGDTITGNLKFHDTVSFTPRCKIIASCNHMPLLNDNSDGMRRRIMFCSFLAKFTDCKDVKLKDKLLAERSGIFNRTYRNYKDMLAREDNGQVVIRPACDQEALLASFSELADPVLAFWQSVSDDYIERGEIPCEVVYRDYCAWCERTHNRSLTEQSFKRAFRNAVEHSLERIGLVRIKKRLNERMTYCYAFVKPDAKLIEGLLQGL